MRSLLNVLLAIVLFASFVEPSNAAFPGENGKLLFTVRTGPRLAESIFTINQWGKDVRRLTRGTGAAWSPDGKWIAFTRKTGRENGLNLRDLFVVRADGSNERQLTFSGEAGYGGLRWHPDGGQIAIESDEDHDDQRDIYVVSVADGSVTQVTDDAQSEGSLDWSPDGSAIAYSNGEDIFTVTADGSTSSQLTHSPGRDGSPDWSPDGSKIVFVSDRDDEFGHPDGPLTSELYVIDPSGENESRITYTKNPSEAIPQWSHDGSLILYWRWFDDDLIARAPEVFVIRPDGTGQDNISETPLGVEGPPIWSPDGRWILCEFTSRRDAALIKLMRLDESAQRLFDPREKDDYPLAIDWQSRSP